MTDSDHATSPPKKRKWLILLRPKVAIPLVLVVLLLLSPVLIRGWNLSKIPDLGDPYSEWEEPKLKDSENAWVNYERARELRIEPEHDSNALFVILPWVETPGKTPDWISFSKSFLESSAIPSEGRHAEESRLRQDYFEQNQPALEEWKAGTAQDRYYEVDRPVDPLRSIRWDGADEPDSFLLAFHELAFVKAGQLANQGKHLEALDWMLAVYRYSRHLTQSGGTANWERARAVSQSVFRTLDVLLDEEAFTHEELIEFQYKLEASYERMTGTLERAQLEDYFTLKQRLTDAYQKGEAYREELELSVDHPGLWMVPESKSNFELYLEGEPRLSIRVMQHHFESLKQNLYLPVPDRVTDTSGPWGTHAEGVSLTADEWKEFRAKAGLLELAVTERDLFTNPFLVEDDAAVFESLRILIAAHAFDRRSSDQLPDVTRGNLDVDSLFYELPRDPYNPSRPLVLAAGREGWMYIVTSKSNKYEHLANGGTLETLPEELTYSTLSLIINGHHPPDKPGVEEMMFRLPVEE